MANTDKANAAPRWIAVAPFILGAWALPQQVGAQEAQYCGVGSKVTQGKPGHTCFGTERVGSCTAQVEWWCKPGWVRVKEVSGAGSDVCRVVDFSFGEGSIGRTWLHLSDSVMEVPIADIPATTELQPVITDCAIFKYKRIEAEGYRDASEITDKETSATGRPSSEGNTPLAIGRQLTEAETLFGSALSMTPEQLKAEIATARMKADNPDPSPSSPENTGDAEGFLRIMGAIVGGYVAGRTGNTALLELATGQEPGSLSGLSQAPAYRGGGGSSDQCTRLGQQFQADLARLQGQYGHGSPCPLMKAQLTVYESYRPRVIQTCAGQPGYEVTLRDFNTQIPAYKNSLASMGCR